MESELGGDEHSVQPTDRRVDNEAIPTAPANAPWKTTPERGVTPPNSNVEQNGDQRMQQSDSDLSQSQLKNKRM